MFNSDFNNNICDLFLNQDFLGNKISKAIIFPISIINIYY